MPLADILQWNKAFAKRGEITRDETWRESARILVITCSCPDLTSRIEPALGLRAGQACVVRIAGAWGGREGEEILRSVPLAFHLSDCTEVLVIGHDKCSYCPADRGRIRDRLSAAGVLDELDDGGESLLMALRGPNSPERGVRETVRMLRQAGGVPRGTPVHGCMMEPKSGALRVIDRDKSVPEIKPAAVREQTPDAIPDIPLPELPEIPLPDIPDFDLDAITQPKPPPLKKKITYGSDQPNQGPVSFAQVSEMPQGRKLTSQPIQVGRSTSYQDRIEITTPEVSFEIPEAPKIQDTGLDFDTPDTAPKEGITARQDVTERESISAKQDVTARKRVEARRHLRKESPEATPTRNTPPQRPLGERELRFEESTPSRRTQDPRVDIENGYVTHRGTEYPLDPELQRALVKIMRFVGSEISQRTRRDIVETVRRGASSGQPFGELLKLMIGPILKLGKKRYAVINELLKAKEDLPRLDPDVSVAILEKILSGN
jgi:carbonic anhydrase